MNAARRRCGEKLLNSKEIELAGHTVLSLKHCQSNEKLFSFSTAEMLPADPRHISPAELRLSSARTCLQPPPEALLPEGSTQP